MRQRYPQRVSKRRLRLDQAFLSMARTGEVPDVLPEPVKRGKQPESETNKEVAKWASHQPGLLLGRNKRRLAVPVGYDKPILLGWLVEGSADWIGYQSLTVTADMVGKRVAVFVGIESKRRKGGVTSEAQDKFLDDARDAGAIVGVARSYEDCGDIVRRWRERT